MDVYKHTREAVRVKVMKCDPNIATPEWRKFSVDPQITTLEVLYSLLAKAFEIKADFSIKYKAFDPAGNEIYLAVLSDWDLDAAFLRIHNLSIQTASEPCLALQIDVKPFTELKECETETITMRKQLPATTPAMTTSAANAREIIAMPLQQSQKYVQHMQTRLPGLILNQMEKTFSIVQKAFNITEDNSVPAIPPRPPLSDNEFRLFLDTLGQIQRTDELRKVIFFGGIESGLRRVVWKHILNVYPNGMNGHQRMDFMRRKAEQYCKMRDTWKEAIKNGCLLGELGYVTSMVKKDVLRTDRLHTYYAGSDDNQNIASLFNILTTYALNHPSVSYCQGMSDIASPLLVTMNDEAQAYICFCAIMQRLRGNFLLDGIAMTQKFAHLSEALSYYDPQFWEYLKAQQADDLLFCYRWLLLELKREFPFDDALRMLEVQWSSLRYDTTTQNTDLSLFEKEFVPLSETSAPATGSSYSSSISASGNGVVGSPSSYLLNRPRESAYTKFCDLRRQSSSASLSSLSSSSLGSTSHALDATKRLNQSLDDNISRPVLTRRQNRISSKSHQSMDETKMLMLMENSEFQNTINAPTPSRHHDNDDDNIEHAIEKLHFQFHPTNPFKDDVQQIELNQKPAPTTATTEPKPIARVFLNSSSSSIAEDETTTTTVTLAAASELPSSIAKLQNKNILSNYNTVSNIIAKQLTVNAATVGETMKRVSNTSGGHFKELKDKIAASSKKGISYEELTNRANFGVGVIAADTKPKLVKNFNEFLNFATTNKNFNADKIEDESTHATQMKTTPSATGILQKSPSLQPAVQFFKSNSRVPSLEDSDSTCSIPDTTWSNSTTAATAIQQGQSLNLELNSFSSANFACTPADRTPGGFSPLNNEVYDETNNITQLTRAPNNNKNSNKYRLTFESDNEQEEEEFNENDEIQDGVAVTCVSESDCDDVFMAPKIPQKPQQQRRATISFESSSSSDANNLNPFIDGSNVFCMPNSTSLPEVLIPVSTISDDGNGVHGFDCDSEIAAAAHVEIATNVIADDDDTGIEQAKKKQELPFLPPPHIFGGGNPFLMFLCVTLLLQHRNTIIKNNMDYNEIAMHFDKMVRRHDVTRVLNQARRMYIDYMKHQRQQQQQQQQQQQ